MSNDLVDLTTEDIKNELKSVGIERFNTIIEDGYDTVTFFGGVINTFRLPVKLKNGAKDYMINLTIIEPTLDGKVSHVKMNIFHKVQESLPVVAQRGDIILCTNMKVSIKFNNLASTTHSKWIVFSQENDEPRYSKDINYNIEEKDSTALKIFRYWIDKSNFMQQQKEDVIQISKHRSLTKTEDLNTKMFVDYVGKFLSYGKLSNVNYPMVLVLLTDYTKTKTPLKYVDKKLSNIIDDDYILQCTLYDEHASGCPELSFGDYVLIENAYCKLNNDGVLELALRGDRNSMEKKVKIYKLDDQDSLVQDIKTRQNYEKNRKRKNPDNDVINFKTKLVKKGTLRIYAKLNSNPERWSYIDNVINSELDQSFFLRVSVIDYKPKNIVDVLVKYCNLCEISSKIDSNHCRFCQNKELIPVYRYLLKIKDNNNDLLLVTAYGSPNNSIFPDIPVVDLRKDTQIQEKLQTRLNLLCANGINPSPMLNICIKSSTRYNTKRFTITDTQYIVDET